MCDVVFRGYLMGFGARSCRVVKRGRWEGKVHWRAQRVIGTEGRGRKQPGVRQAAGCPGPGLETTLFKCLRDH